MLKQNDFIELDYTGYTLEGDVFDTTNKDVAKKHNLKDANYKPLVIAVGRKHILPGLDQKLIGLKEGKHEIKLDVEEAFGKKDPKLLKLMPMKLFQKEQIRPFVGLELNIDDRLGIVRNVSGGRVIVDFNHPLSGKPVKYEVNILKKIEDDETKIKGVLNILSIPYDEFKIVGKIVKLKTKMQFPPQLVEIINKEISQLTNHKVEFESNQEKTEKKEGDNKKV